MWFVTFVLANLLGRPIRSTLTMLGVGVAVAAVVALVGTARDFERSLLDMYRQRGIDLLVYQAGKVQLTSSILPEDLERRIAELPETGQVTACLYDVVSLLEDDLLGVPVQGMPATSFLMDKLKLSNGRFFREDDQQVVMLGSALASALEKKVGDTIDVLENEPFTVVGIFDSFNVFENGAAVMKLQELQRLMLREHEVTAFFVIARRSNPASVEALRLQIQGLAAGVQARPAREVAEETAEMRMVRSIAWLTSSIALVIGSIGMLNTMLMAVFERTRELAMLRAIGWRKRRIIAMVLSESLVLSLVGAIVGSLAAMTLVRVLSSLPASGRLISGDISWQVVAQGFGIALLLGLMGGVYPAYSASRLPPIEGLRHE